MTTGKVDILDIALADNDSHQPLIVERYDGHRSITDLAWWRRTPSAEPPADAFLTNWVSPHETAVDVGCATGRGLELLQARRANAFGIDTNPTAVDLAIHHGQRAFIANARTWALQTPVDVVLALGGGAGICGRLEDLREWLGHLTTWLKPGGRLIVTSVDWRQHGRHRAWVEAAKARGDYPGNVTLRLHYGEHIGEWFPWLWADPASLIESAATVRLLPRRTAVWGAKFGIELLHEGRNP
ncbi:hypothetical protein Rhe02_92830 [Rhizocola hellebori]|uniref:Class I SAM-dependent methyltransferase n=1 Tax=Rhizocola hellebori TaxID=1392758 RepID=A0A8J3VMH4_9ACTN|nr:methyltransferase domain-containing protein [Rhizocola hellebori]GIH11216.1 hypothetical protein Rhe02_92830 [Rhizocola hellebori]